MKKIFLCLILSVFYFSSKAQIFSWAKTVASGTAPSRCASVITDPAGNSYSVWSYRLSAGAVDMDPGPGVVMSSPAVATGTNAFITKLDPAGNFVWAKEFRATVTFGACYPANITIDASGNLYFLGNLENTVDFDPGTGVTPVTAGSTTDLFICKIDNSGALVWAERIALVYSNEDACIAVDGMGDVLITGGYVASFPSLDFDPGPGVVNLPATPIASTFLMKLNPAGALIWVIRAGEAYGNVSPSLAIDNANNIYAAGAGSEIVKYDPFADTLWVAPQIGFPYSLTCDPVGNVIAVGYYNAATDFDPGSGSFMLTPVAGKDIFVLKLSASGGFHWARSMGGPNDQIANAVTTDSYGNCLITGVFTNTVDFNPGPAVVSLTAGSPLATFVERLDAAGMYDWVFQVAGGNPQATRIKRDNANNLFINGFLNGSSDFDPGPGVFSIAGTISGRGFLAKYSPGLCYDLSVVVDSTSHVSCGAPGYASSFAYGGTRPYSYVWNTTPVTNDSITAFMSSGIYQVVVSDFNGCTSSMTVLIDGPVFPSGFDLSSSMNSTPHRVAAQSTLFLDGLNDGCVAVSGNMKLVLDTLVNFVSSVPVPNSISGDTLIWNFSNLTYDSAHLVPNVVIQVPAWAVTGDSVRYELIILPSSGDSDPSNNFKEYAYPLVNAYSSREKSVFPPGACIPRYVGDDQTLTYTVRFQNTGSATATNISILDSLDLDLNLDSVRVIASSHPVITEVYPGNVLKFRFDDINLPDSTSNEPESHGYVIFEVKPVAGIAVGTAITNKAGIYFDYNSPVYTNTVFNTVGDGTLNLGATAVGTMLSADMSGVNYQWINCTTGTPLAGATGQTYTATAGGSYAVIISDGCTSDTSSCLNVFITGMQASEISDFTFFPNPSNNTITVTTSQATEISVLNTLGEIVLRKKVENGDVVDLSSVAKGIYFIRTDQGYLTKLIKQ